MASVLTERQLVAADGRRLECFTIAWNSLERVPLAAYVACEALRGIILARVSLIIMPIPNIAKEGIDGLRHKACC